MSSSNGILALDPGIGYGIVIGIGAFFALLMLGLTYLQNRYTSYSTKSSEEFSTASRSVKPGLIAAGIVSSWTWSATLLTSSTFSYTYGISGGMWYGCMGTWQILLFALIAIKIKSNAPGAHTFPEIVLSKHGKIAHATYLFYGLATNMLVGAVLVLGGSQAVAAISGVNVYAACFLIPLVVAAYVVSGGLRSTFIADYTHTAILFIAILVFTFSVYVTNPTLGSIDRFYDLLVEASSRMPIEGNHEGSYLTFKSNGGLVFAFNLFVSGFSCVWLDQAYWQRAIASKPETSVKAYIMGGVAWYGIPFSFATAMGLGCAALTGSTTFPTYPNPLSAAQNGEGLSSPATAIALLGKGGAGLLLLVLFMAITSATSAELIAVSSLLAYDVYKTYLKPKATPDQVLRVSHYSILIYCIVLAGFCCILNAASVNLTWLLTCLGIIVGGASVPVGLVLLWPRMSTAATIVAPWIGFASGITAWFVVTTTRSGEITVSSTGDPTNAVAGNLVSWGIGSISAVLLSFFMPKKWEAIDEVSISRINKINGFAPQTVHLGSTPVFSEDKRISTTRETIKNKTTDYSQGPETDLANATPVVTGNEVVDYLETQQIEPMDPEMVAKATRLAVFFNISFLVIAILLVPFTLFGTQWTFTRAGFKGWCIVSFIWVWVSMIICVCWPLYESWNSLASIGKGIVKDIGSVKSAKREATTDVV